MATPYGFRWLMCHYTGGSTAVHQAYKTYMILQPDDWAMGEITVQPRDTTQLNIMGLGFEPDVLILISYRPKLANGTTDSSFGARGGGYTFGAADASTQFTGSARFRHAFEPVWAQWRENACFAVVHDGFEALRLELDSFTADGFKLNQIVNLYDQTDPIAWLALKGNFKVGIMDAGTTSIGGYTGTPQGAVFFSIKKLQTQAGALQSTFWDFMQGFASPSGQNCIWGGRRTNNWDYTTERWSDTKSILLCQAAISGPGHIGASVDVEAGVTSWHSGGIDLQWYTFNNQPYRIGYILCPSPAEADYLETNFHRRPGGIQNDFPDGSNWEPTSFRPEVILMAATNYNFDFGDADPMNWPRLPDEFWAGGSGGFGWHVAPFSEDGIDAIGVHTYGNNVAERGNYANSGTQYLRRCILAGQGANSQPPAAHQHAVNVIPNPVIVGLNTRHQARRQPGNIHRIHINPDDPYANL